MTWREYLWKEATDVQNIVLVAMLALTIWAALWFSPTIERASEWYRAYIACVEETPPSRTRGDVIRSRRRCV